MKKQKEIFAGILIMVAGFFVGIIVALIVVNSDITSKASNDGWLGFLGGLFGSFISGMITFYVLYINRKDVQTDVIKRQRTSEMDKMESDLKDAFALLRIESKIDTAESYFLFIFSKVPKKYKETRFYKYLFNAYQSCKDNKIQQALVMEVEVYREFFKYREMYIEGK